MTAGIRAATVTAATTAPPAPPRPRRCCSRTAKSGRRAALRPGGRGSAAGRMAAAGPPMAAVRLRRAAAGRMAAAGVVRANSAARVPLCATPAAEQSAGMEKPADRIRILPCALRPALRAGGPLVGSRARGFARRRSDIDPAIAAPGAGVLEWDRVRQVAEAADTLLKVDVVRLDDLSAQPPLRQTIEEAGQVVYRRGALAA